MNAGYINGNWDFVSSFCANSKKTILSLGNNNKETLYASLLALMYLFISVMVLIPSCNSKLAWHTWNDFQCKCLLHLLSFHGFWDICACSMCDTTRAKIFSVWSFYAWFEAWEIFFRKSFITFICYWLCFDKRIIFQVKYFSLAPYRKNAANWK